MDIEYRINFYALDSIQETYSTEEIMQAGQICIDALSSMLNKLPEFADKAFLLLSETAFELDDLESYEQQELLDIVLAFHKDDEIELTDTIKDIIIDSRCIVYAFDADKFFPKNTELTDEQRKEYIINNLPEFFTNNLI